MKSPLKDVVIPEDVLLPEFLLTRLARYGNKTAMIDGITGHSVTYAEILHQVERLSGALWAEYGVTSGHVVCLVLPNCLEYIVLVLGIIKTGATVTTCNPAYKPGELRQQLEDSKSCLVVTNSANLRLVKDAVKGVGTIKDIILTDKSDDVSTITMSRLMSGTRSKSDVTLPEIKSNPKKDIAVLLYSSGTTGKPKGVMVTHYNCIASICQFSAPEYALGGPSDVFLAITPMFHVYGLNVVLFTGLYFGGTLVPLPRFDPETFLQAIEKYKVTFLYVTPPTMLFLSQHPLVDKYKTSSVHTIFSGAAPLSADIAEHICQRFSADVRQGYGMTEATPGILIATPWTRPFSSIGVPMPNSEVKVCHLDTGAELSANQVGEIHVRGPQIMLGYFGNQAATEQTLDADGWLHTGDIGYYSEQGLFFVVDRLKELIKYKAFQVAPAELENVLLSHPAIDDAAVVGQQDVMGGGELPTAFIVTNTAITSQAVKDFVKEKVASYKQLRGGVFFVDSIPKSPSGKILRRLLRDRLTPKPKL